MVEIDSNKNKIDKFQITIIILTLALFFAFGVYHLGKFITVDEPKWIYSRVPQLYNAISQGNFDQTYINDKPGIFPALLAGIVNLFRDIPKSEPTLLANYLFYWRLPLIVINFIFLALAAYFLFKLTNPVIASITTILLAINPIIIGASQIVNPDSTVWSTSFLAFLAFMIYLKHDDKKYIIISSFFLALALLSKNSASLIYPAFVGIVLIEHFVKNNFDAYHLKSRFLELGKLVVISLVIYFIFAPFTWGNLDALVGSTLLPKFIKSNIWIIGLGLILILGDLFLLESKFINTIRRKTNVEKLFKIICTFMLLATIVVLAYNLWPNNATSLENFLNSYNKDNRSIFSNLEVLYSSLSITFFTLTLPLIIGLILFLIYQIKENNKEKGDKIITLSAIMFILAFIAGSSLEGLVLLPRYQAMIYPMLALIASYGWIECINQKRFQKILVISIAIVCILTAYFSAPFYISYTNSINTQKIIVTDSWGMGGYELAQIANNLPNAENLIIWSDREGFTDFFIGKGYWRGKNPDPFRIPELDYLVLTPGGKKIYLLGLEQYKTTKKSSYGKVAEETDLMDYYEKMGYRAVYINEEKDNFVKLVPID